jgi:hypothetical protein
MHKFQILKKSVSRMLNFIRPRLFCGVVGAAETATSSIRANQPFTGRVGTSTNPRSIAPIITSNVLNNDQTISFTCISRNAAAKAVHAAAIANTKNIQTTAAFIVPSIAPDVKPEGGQLTKGLTPFRLTIFPDTRPQAPSADSVRFTRRTRVSANVDHEELARNIHISYMKKTPMIFECMGDKAMGIVTQAIALFNERVQAHDLATFVQIISGKAADGSDVVKMEFQIVEKPKNSVSA